ncbi:MAG: S41 family peptidase [Clostridia bacterium]|nr:S41 family peptidase [Clostridia bacterium]
MKDKKISLSVVITAVIISMVLTAGLVLCLVPNAIKGYLTDADSLSKYLELEGRIKRSFVDEVDEKALADGVALGLIYSLNDPYSAYFDAEEYDKILDNNEGLDAGIGLFLTRHPDNGYIYVINVSVGSPADLAGIKIGDLITAVDGKDVIELGFSTAVANIRGKIDTDCALTVKRGDETLSLTATRGRFVTTSVFSHMIDSLCYIQITDFNAATVPQFEAAINDAIDNNATGLIFDVRGNGGGTLDSVDKILDILLPEGEVVSATYKNGKKKVLFSSDKNEIDLPMMVLCDENTASAAELFAASIRDFEKGKLIGTKTYGKGIMQETFALSDGSAVRLTVAYFNPPSGINFHKVGLSPDYEVQLTEDEQKYYYFLTDQTDPVIKKAVEILTSD